VPCWCQMQAGRSPDLLLAQLIDIGFGYEAASAAISATHGAGSIAVTGSVNVIAVTQRRSRNDAALAGLQTYSRRFSGSWNTQVLAVLARTQAG
jgi:hypothetical protein